MEETVKKEKKTKKPKAGKGSKWERDICKFLSKWIDGQDSDRILLWRGRGSGAMFTQSGSKIGRDFSGDIYSTSPDSYFLTDNFSIEAKCGYPDASLDKHLKDKKIDIIEDFWKQCTDDAKKSDKLPLLIFKKTGLKCPWLGINKVTYEKLRNYLFDCRCVSLKFGNELDLIFLFNMNEFFEKVSAEVVKNIQWK